MKNLTLTFLFVLLIGKCADAQYIVTKVAGRVKGEDGVYIKPGSQLKGSEHLTWSSLKDKLWVVIIGKGEKTIAPSPDVAATNNVFVQLLSSSLHQDSKSASLSGRGNSNEKIPEVLHTSPGSNGKLIIENENKFLFDPQQYPQADNGFFFVEIDIPLQVPVTRRLKTNADTLYINYYDLATETYNADYRYRLGYRRLTGTAKSESVSFFDPYFDLAADMETTIASAILAYQATGVAKDAARDSVYQNVYANIGKPNSFLFNSAFERYWKSKGVYGRENNTSLGTGAIVDGKAFDSLPKQSASVITTRGRTARPLFVAPVRTADRQPGRFEQLCWLGNIICGAHHCVCWLHMVIPKPTITTCCYRILSPPILSTTTSNVLTIAATALTCWRL